MLPTLIDTDTLSAVMKQRPSALTNAHAYLAVHNHLTLSVITRYEILRGLKAIGATAKEAAFTQFCSANVILPVTDAIILRAADIYAAGNKSRFGYPLTPDITMLRTKYFWPTKKTSRTGRSASVDAAISRCMSVPYAPWKKRRPTASVNLSELFR